MAARGGNLFHKPGYSEANVQLGAFSISPAVKDPVLPRVLPDPVKPSGVDLAAEADETTNGPASFIAVDPDGNPILVDQHV